MTAHDFDDFCRFMMENRFKPGKSRPIPWKFTDISRALYGHPLNATQLRKFRTGEIDCPPWLGLACAAIVLDIPPYKARTPAPDVSKIDA